MEAIQDTTASVDAPSDSGEPSITKPAPTTTLLPIRSKTKQSSSRNRRKSPAPVAKKSRGRVKQRKDAPIYKIEKIVARKCVEGKFQYLVKWQGYGVRANSWIPRENFSSYDPVDEFDKMMEIKLVEKDAQMKVGDLPEDSEPSESKSQEDDAPLSPGQKEHTKEAENLTAPLHSELSNSAQKTVASPESSPTDNLDNTLPRQKKKKKPNGEVAGLRIFLSNLSISSSIKPQESSALTSSGAQQKSIANSTAVFENNPKSKSSKLTASTSSASKRRTNVKFSTTMFDTKPKTTVRRKKIIPIVSPSQVMETDILVDKPESSGTSSSKEETLSAMPPEKTHSTSSATKLKTSVKSSTIVFANQPETTVRRIKIIPIDLPSLGTVTGTMSEKPESSCSKSSEEQTLSATSSEKTHSTSSATKWKSGVKSSKIVFAKQPETTERKIKIVPIDSPSQVSETDALVDKPISLGSKSSKEDTMSSIPAEKTHPTSSATDWKSNVKSSTILSANQPETTVRRIKIIPIDLPSLGTVIGTLSEKPESSCSKGSEEQTQSATSSEKLGSVSEIGILPVCEEPPLSQSALMDVSVVMSDISLEKEQGQLSDDHSETSKTSPKSPRHVSQDDMSNASVDEKSGDNPSPKTPSCVRTMVSRASSPINFVESVSGDITIDDNATRIKSSTKSVLKRTRKFTRKGKMSIKIRSNKSFYNGISVNKKLTPYTKRSLSSNSVKKLSVKVFTPASNSIRSEQSSTSEENDEDAFIVERILDKKYENGSPLYLVKWRDYPASENSWIPKKNFASIKMIKDFEQQARTELWKASSRAESVNSTSLEIKQAPKGGFESPKIVRRRKSALLTRSPSSNQEQNLRKRKVETLVPSFSTSAAKRLKKTKSKKSKSNQLAKKTYSVEKIIDKKFYNGRTLYFVKWENYGPEENSWIPEENFVDPKIIKEFENQNQSDIPVNQSQSENFPSSSLPSRRTPTKGLKNSSSASLKTSPQDESYVIEKILAKKNEQGIPFYFVKWKNFPDSENCWIPKENFNSPRMVREYEQRMRNAIWKASSRSTNKEPSTPFSQEQVQQQQRPPSKSLLQSNDRIDSNGKKSSAKNPPTSLPIGNNSVIEPLDETSSRANGQEETESSNEDDCYVIEKIIDKKSVDGNFFYLVKWENFDSSENTWIPEENFNSNDMIKEFNQKRMVLDHQKSAGKSFFPMSGASKDDSSYTFEKILGKKNVKGVDYYLVKWEGYGYEHNCWIPSTNFESDQPIKDYEEKQRERILAKFQAKGIFLSSSKPRQESTSSERSSNSSFSSRSESFGGESSMNLKKSSSIELNACNEIEFGKTSQVDSTRLRPQKIVGQGYKGMAAFYEVIYEGDDEPKKVSSERADREFPKLVFEYHQSILASFSLGD